MKKVFIIIWGLLVISIVTFIISVATMSTQAAWQMFSLVAGCGTIAFWGTVITVIIDFVHKKKDKK